MAFEYEDLELELLDLEDELEMESFVLDSPGLLQFVPFPDSPIWLGDTHKHRALNRRVEVLIAPAGCGMTL